MRTVFVAVMAACSLALTVGAAPRAEELTEDLHSRLPRVRVDAARALARTGDKSVVPDLMKALGDPDPAVRRQVAKALGILKDKRATRPLIDALTDKDRNVQFYAAYALGEIKDPRATEPLLKALKDPAWCVRDQAAWALREIHRAGGPDLTPRLIGTLKNEDVDASHVMWLIEQTAGPGLTEQLTSLLKSGNDVARLRAVHLLRELGGKEAVEPLISALEDASPEVRLAAVQGLRKIGDKRAKEPLSRLAKRETNKQIREAAEKAAFQMSIRSDLVAYWSFDDQATDVAKDVSRRENDAKILGCKSIKGKKGHALLFGDDHHVSVGKPPGLPVADKPLTIMAWAKSTAKNGVVVGRGGAFCGFCLYIMDGRPKFGIHRIKEGPAYITASEQDVVGKWVHLAGIVKKDRIELYVNGSLVDQQKTKGYLPSNCGQPMQIGFDSSNSATEEITDNFQGIIDEVKVFHAALSPAEIAEQAPLKQE